MDSIKNAFAPGCALMIYKPKLAEKIFKFLNRADGNIELYSYCCQQQPLGDEIINIINVCPGCDNRFKHDYKNTTTISLWEMLAESETFPFPDYKGKLMTILDACPTREEAKIQDAIRALLKRMNIRITEPLRTRNKSICCGDSFYGEIPVPQVKEQMIKRAGQMPVDDVVVYCVSCTKSIFIGGKTPHYLIDLLFNEETIEKTLDPDLWHKELSDYKSGHKIPVV